jgi:hypothetical protein
MNPTGAGDKTIARMKAVPTAPFTITVRIRQTPHNTTGDSGIILYNSTSGRSLRMLQLTTAQFFSQQWAAFDTFNANIASGPTIVACDLAAWMRVTVDGSGNVSFFYSRDGAFWKALGTTTLATYLTAAGGTLDKVGVFGRLNGSGGTSGACVEYYAES